LIFESKKIEEDGMKRFFTALVLLVFVFAGNYASAAPYAYITQRDSGAVTVYDTVKNKKVTTIDVGGAPLAVAMSLDGRKAYVVSDNFPNGGWVSVIDVLTHSVTNTIAIPGNSSQGSAILPNRSKLYVADCGAMPPVSP
jgi:YVTN family beta-propeller protein